MMATFHKDQTEESNPIKKVKNLKLLTWPGGRIASNLSTPNMPKLDNVKVPAVKGVEFNIII